MRGDPGEGEIRGREGGQRARWETRERI